MKFSPASKSPNAARIRTNRCLEEKRRWSPFMTLTLGLKRLFPMEARWCSWSWFWPWSLWDVLGFVLGANCNILVNCTGRSTAVFRALVSCSSFDEFLVKCTSRSMGMLLAHASKTWLCSGHLNCASPMQPNFTKSRDLHGQKYGRASWPCLPCYIAIELIFAPKSFPNSFFLSQDLFACKIKHKYL